MVLMICYRVGVSPSASSSVGWLWFLGFTLRVVFMVSASQKYCGSKNSLFASRGHQFILAIETFDHS